jgi:hypothetical protein
LCLHFAYVQDEVCNESSAISDVAAVPESAIAALSFFSTADTYALDVADRLEPSGTQTASALTRALGRVDGAAVLRTLLARSVEFDSNRTSVTTAAHALAHPSRSYLTERDAGADSQVDVALQVLSHDPPASRFTTGRVPAAPVVPSRIVARGVLREDVPLWQVGPPRVERRRSAADALAVARRHADAGQLAQQGWWYARGGATLSWAYMYIIFRAFAVLSGDPLWVPHVPPLCFPELDTYVQLVVTDFRVRGVSVDALERMHWDYYSHLSSEWQEWLLVPRNYELARAVYGSAGEPRVEEFAHCALAFEPPHGHALVISETFQRFYAWCCAEKLNASTARAQAAL